MCKAIFVNDANFSQGNEGSHGGGKAPSVAEAHRKSHRLAPYKRPDNESSVKEEDTGDLKSTEMTLDVQEGKYSLLHPSTDTV